MDEPVPAAISVTWRGIDSEVHDGGGLFDVHGSKQRQQLKDLDEDLTVG